MDYEKRYELQVKVNEDLREEIKLLTEENKRLAKENEWQKVVRESQNEELKGVVEELTEAHKKFQEALAEIKKKEKVLDGEIKYAQTERVKYKKQMESFFQKFTKEMTE